MSRYKYQSNMTDGNGKVINGGTINVFETGTTTPADVYVADAGGSAVSSVTSDSNGYFFFWADTSDYAVTQKFRLTLSATNFESKTYDDVQVFPIIGFELIDDTTPQLGGDLDMNGHLIQTVNETEMTYVKGVTSAIQTQMDTKALDSAVVHDTGNETIAGVKTFSSSPEVPAPTTEFQTSTKGYADSLGAKIQTVSGTVAANALTVTLNPTILDFRSSTLASGTINTRNISPAISMVISSGSTLGTISAEISRIILLAIDNSGTIELAVVNQSGGNNLDETTRISTTAEGGAGAADTANVFYSTTARTNVPFRVVGYIESTQATAGTWVTAPSTIQGFGGQALAAMASFGFGQTLVDVSGSRTLGVTYYNDTGKLIKVYVKIAGTNTGQTSTVTVDGNIINGEHTDGIDFSQYLQATVGPGESYVVAASAGSIGTWDERR